MDISVLGVDLGKNICSVVRLEAYCATIIRAVFSQLTAMMSV